MAATLAGLLFVALSFNLELLARAEHEPTHRIATEAFIMFLYVLLFAAVRRAWYLLVTVRRLELRAAAR